jgi:glycosyltransferase involved in cell wall biosynthesis
MVKKKLVDIILPVYNSEKFIIKTINSIINQTFDSWRIIIIDDSSTDKTLKVVCDYYKDFIYKKKILILKNSINRGQAFCRNLGLKYSKSLSDAGSRMEHAEPSVLRSLGFIVSLL